MSLPRSLRSLVPLVIGLGVGSVGASLFLDSLPGSAGSPQERVNHLEIELRRATHRIAELEAAPPQTSGSLLERLAGEKNSPAGRHPLADGARRIAEDIRAGRPVSPEDIFRASQPLMRDLAPLFDRMRLKEQRQAIESMTGELARKYQLAPLQQQRLKEWFEERAADEAKRWSELIARDGTRLEDVLRASRNIRPDEGLDAFMPNLLSGDKLLAFQAERMSQRVQRVESQADAMVERLDSVVDLDDPQRDQVFGIMARSSRDYDPRMVLEGAGGTIGLTPGGDRQTALLAVLRPDQRTAYAAEQQHRREEAEKDAQAVGLTLPPDWDAWEDNFR